MKRCGVLWKEKPKKVIKRKQLFTRKWLEAFKKNVDDSLDAEFGKQEKVPHAWRKYQVKW